MSDMNEEVLVNEGGENTPQEMESGVLAEDAGDIAEDAENAFDDIVDTAHEGEKEHANNDENIENDVQPNEGDDNQETLDMTEEINEIPVSARDMEEDEMPQEQGHDALEDDHEDEVEESPYQEENKPSEEKDDDEMSNITPEDVFGSSDDDSDDDNDMFMQEEETLAALNAKIAELQAEKEKCDRTNVELQKKAAYILSRIGRDTQSRGGPDTTSDEPTAPDNSNEKETQYLDTLTAIAEGRTKLLQHQSEYDQLALDLQSRLDDKEFKAEEIRDSLYQFKREILTKAENSRTGKGISKRLMKHYDISEQKKDSELEKVRLRNIGLRTTLKKLEKSLRSREQLAEGLHMIDFEQLKIENQTLNEKIEERNEELAKLKRKKTVTVQILTHIREKLRYVKTQEAVARTDLSDVDQQIIDLRSTLTSSKHDRDEIREENVELKRQRGFATSDQLIIDFDKRRTTIESLEIAIKELQERHFLLTKQIATYNETIKRNTESKGATLFPPIKQY